MPAGGKRRTDCAIGFSRGLGQGDNRHKLGKPPQPRRRAFGLSALGCAIAELAIGDDGDGDIARPQLLEPGDFAGKSPGDIDKVARAKGLIPKGPDPMGGQGAYVDPVTGKQRVLVHPDGSGGGHVHVNDPNGQRLGANGQPVDPDSPDAHLPLGP